MLGPQSAIFAIARSGRSNLCPSHYSLNSLSEFDGLTVGQFPVTQTLRVGRASKSVETLTSRHCAASAARRRSDHNPAFLSYLFHDESGFTDPVINMAIIGRGVKSFRDNSISARVLICMRQLLSAVSPDGTRWRSRAVTPLYGIAAAHPFAVLASAEVGQIFRTGDPHGARSVVRHYRKLSASCGSRGRYRKHHQQGECKLDEHHGTAALPVYFYVSQCWYKSKSLNPG